MKANTTSDETTEVFAMALVVTSIRQMYHQAIEEINVVNSLPITNLNTRENNIEISAIRWLGKVHPNFRLITQDYKYKNDFKLNN